MDDHPLAVADILDELAKGPRSVARLARACGVVSPTSGDLSYQESDKVRRAERIVGTVCHLLARDGRVRRTYSEKGYGARSDVWALKTDDERKASQERHRDDVRRRGVAVALGPDAKVKHGDLVLGPDAIQSLCDILSAAVGPDEFKRFMLEGAFLAFQDDVAYSGFVSGQRPTFTSEEAEYIGEQLAAGRPRRPVDDDEEAA